jgi:hypothetical protein
MVFFFFPVLSAVGIGTVAVNFSAVPEPENPSKSIEYEIDNILVPPNGQVDYISRQTVFAKVENNTISFYRVLNLRNSGLDPINVKIVYKIQYSTIAINNGQSYTIEGEGEALMQPIEMPTTLSKEGFIQDKPPVQIIPGTKAQPAVSGICSVTPSNRRFRGYCSITGTFFPPYTLEISSITQNDNLTVTYTDHLGLTITLN